MTRRVLLPLAGALATAALTSAGCGQSEEEQYIDAYKPLNARLLRIGEALGRAPLDVAPGSNAKRAAQFGRYASDLDGVNQDIAALDTPDSFKADSVALTEKIDVVVKDLEKISRAAREGDGKMAAAATLALADDSNDVNRAQNELAGATGADVGTR